MVDCVLGTGLRAHNIRRKYVLLPGRVLGLLQSIEIDQRLDKAFRPGFTKTKLRFPCSLLSSLSGEGRGCVQGSSQRGGLGVSPTFMVMLCGGGHSEHVLLLPTSSGSWVFSGSWAFDFFVSFLLLLAPNCSLHNPLVPYSLYFVV